MINRSYFDVWQGRIQDFQMAGEGEGHKMIMRACITSAKSLTPGLGSSARFRALETLKGFICSIKLSEPYFDNYSDTNGIKRKSFKKIFYQH